MDPDYFYFKKFKLRNKNASLRINTDGVLLGGWVDVSQSSSILDVGTGGGVIALMMHQKNPAAHIVAIDIDDLSCEEAQFNVTLNGWTEFINVKHTSFFDFNHEVKFDHIICNPPYFGNSTLPQAERLSQAKHGFDVSAFWKAVKRNDRKDTLISIVIPSESADQYHIEAEVQGYRISRIMQVSSREGMPAKRLLITYSQNVDTSEKEFMYIHEEGRNNFSESYQKLLKDFYLKF